MIGILAYGSLIDEPGDDLDAVIVRRIYDVETPFKVEFARSSQKRGGGPTLVPVEEGGAKVDAALLILDSEVPLLHAKTLLWWREKGEKKGIYTHPKNPRLNQVVVECLDQFAGLDTVLYARIGANIDTLDPHELAKLAINSVNSEEGADGNDGISYLINAKNNHIVTPLMEGYEKRILELTSTTSLEDALKRVREKNMKV
jgi:hypothetical protein